MDCTFNFIMDSESDAEDHIADNQTDNKLIFLAVSLKNYPEYLDKSQKPEAKKKKDAAVKSLLKAYEEKFGYVITTKQMQKTISNMKTRLKKKTGENQSGNKHIRLNTWEKILYDLLEGDVRVPFSETTSTLDITTCFKMEDELTQPPEGMNATFVDEDVDEFLTPHNKKLKAEQYETEESRGLTTEELQRVVLIEQLAAARAQKEFYREMLVQKRKTTNEL